MLAYFLCVRYSWKKYGIYASYEALYWINLIFLIYHIHLRSKFRGVRKRSDGSCCPAQHYFVERSNQCERCPPGSRDFYNGLFCGMYYVYNVFF